MDDGDDPFSSLTELCHISYSQEELLKCCRFAGEREPEPENNESLSDENDDNVPVESTGIMMVSPPEDEDENESNIARENDVFHTPPEESTQAASQEHQQTMVAADNQGDSTVKGVSNDGRIDDKMMEDDDSRVVDLGRDTDLGFSVEMELTERIELDSGTNFNESEEFRVMKRKLDSYNGQQVITMDKSLGTSEAAVSTLEKELKKSKLSDENSVLETTRDVIDTEAENLGRSVEKLSRSNFLKSPPYQPTEPVNRDISAKQKIEFCAQGIENDSVRGLDEGRAEGGTEEIEDDDDIERSLDANSVEKQKESGAKRFDADMERFKYVCPENANSVEKKKEVRAKRALPMSMCITKDLAGAEMVPDNLSSSKNHEKAVLTLLDVLRMLSEGYTCDPGLANLSILEVAKRRGMTFP